VWPRAVLRKERRGGGGGFSKEVIKEQPPARNPSATVRRVLQGTNVANQRPPFWSNKLKSCLLLAQSTKSAKFGTKRWLLFFSSTNCTSAPLDGVKRGVRCSSLITVFFYSIQEYTS
jgi:hypothetical protein